MILTDQTTRLNHRLIIWLLGAGYTLFVIYGSLVPLHFRPIPFQQAILYFRHIPYLSIDINGRADWVANIILFIPLPFLWLSILLPKKRISNTTASSFFVFFSCVVLSISIEFTQIFFPPRTVSLNDIIAEGIGAVIGIACWLSFGRNFLTWLSRVKLFQTPISTAQQLLYLYLIGFLFYNLMPLDLTISIAEIYHKWKDGRIILTPFLFHKQEAPILIYGLLTDTVLWIIPAILAVFSSINAVTAWYRLTFFAALIEFLQIFVFTRVTNVNQIMMASVGAWIGVFLGTKLRHKWGGKTVVEKTKPPRYFLPPTVLLGLGGAIVWTIVIAIIFWYPFNFNTDKHFIHERLVNFIATPLTTYYYSTEYRALTELLHKTLFFIPLGAFLSLTVVNIKERHIKFLLHIFCISIMLLIGISIELGKILLPQKSPEITNSFLMLVGGLVGYFGAKQIYLKVFIGTKQH